MTANWVDEGFNHMDVGLELIIWIPAFLFCKVHRPLIFVFDFDHMWHWPPRTTEWCLLQTISLSPSSLSATRIIAMKTITHTLHASSVLSRLLGVSSCIALSVLPNAMWLGSLNNMSVTMEWPRGQMLHQSRPTHPTSAPAVALQTQSLWRACNSDDDDR